MASTDGAAAAANRTSTSTVRRAEIIGLLVQLKVDRIETRALLLEARAHLQQEDIEQEERGHAEEQRRTHRDWQLGHHGRRRMNRPPVVHRDVDKWDVGHAEEREPG